jgi:hypothetical protein
MVHDRSGTHALWNRRTPGLVKGVAYTASLVASGEL